MNGRVAKRLRKIARELNLNPVTSYVPGGPLRRRPDRWDSNELGEQVKVQGPPIQRPGVMVECFRRAYKEAKKIYKGLPPTVLLPEGDAEQETPFKFRVMASMQQFYNAQ